QKLPLAMAIITVLFPTFVLAQETINISQKQLEKLIEQAVDKALAERDAVTTATIIEKSATTVPKTIISTPIVTPSQTPSPDMTIPYGFKFSAYARYGANFQAGDQKYISVDGSYNGSSGIGRLGNEGYGGEYSFIKTFKGENGAIWDANVMIEHWSDELNLKKAYVGVTNLFESQPNVYLWAGRNFHQNPAQEINDYSWMNHNGQGGGIKNFDINGVLLDLGAVGAVKSCDPSLVKDGDNPSRLNCAGGLDTGDKGNYALTSKIHGMHIGTIDVAVYANYGFDSKAIESKDRKKAWQGAIVLTHNTEHSLNQLISRYSNNADNSVYNKTDSLHSTYISYEGMYTFNRQSMIRYLLAYQNYENRESPDNSRKNYAVIVRPMYYWSEIHSTWIEAGYQQVDYDEDGANKGWKLTLSQNISIGMSPDFRPMIRFYVTGGEVNNQHTARTTDTEDTRLDSLNIGAMWEVWF
ncbi:TPA: carbohydrate porin, partial [Yersinia enterocolitica]|nr:carbohydrate porin [Yersinia enterocolitica]